MSIEMERWGKDHWSMLAYVESLCVDSLDGIGVPDFRRVQTNLNRHPGLAVAGLSGFHDGAKYGIRLYGGEELPGPDYDEWDCIDDLECEGLIEIHGTGIHPAYVMTVKGQRLAGILRAHKAAGGKFAEFHARNAEWVS